MLDEGVTCATDDCLRWVQPLCQLRVKHVFNETRDQICN